MLAVLRLCCPVEEEMSETKAKADPTPKKEDAAAAAKAPAVPNVVRGGGRERERNVRKDSETALLFRRSWSFCPLPRPPLLDFNAN